VYAAQKPWNFEFWWSEQDVSTYISSFSSTLVDNPAPGHIDTHVGSARSGPGKSQSLYRATKIQTTDISISGENPINFKVL
jgi:hypothetical protein